MAHAPNYTPITSFSDDETNLASGRSTVRTQKVDDELANIQVSLNAVNENLQQLQRDDGKLKDFIVQPYALSEQTRALLAGKGTPRGVWQPNTEYFTADIVERSSIAHIAISNHNSGSVFNDALWIQISGDGSSLINAQNAAISANQAANSAATAVGAAINLQAGVTSANNAASSALAYSNNASNSATQAQNSETSASAFASVASTKAVEAAQSASIAQASANEALNLINIGEKSAVTTGTESSYVLTLDETNARIKSGYQVNVKFHVDCSDSPTLTINGLPPYQLKHLDNNGEYANFKAGTISQGFETLVTISNDNTFAYLDPALTVIDRIPIVANETIDAQKLIGSEIQLTLSTTNAQIPSPTLFKHGQSFVVTSTADGARFSSSSIFERGVEYQTITTKASEWFVVINFQSVTWRIFGTRLKDQFTPDYTTTVPFPALNQVITISPVINNVAFAPRAYKVYAVFNTTVNGFSQGAKIELGAYNYSGEGSHTVAVEGNEIKAVFGVASLNIRGYSGVQTVLGSNLSLTFEVWK